MPFVGPHTYIMERQLERFIIRVTVFFTIDKLCAGGYDLRLSALLGY